MTRQQNNEEWVSGVVIAAIGALLALTVFLGSTAAGVVHRAMVRHGTSSSFLQVLLVLCVLACLIATVLSVGLGAWTAGGLLALSAVLLLVIGCWLVDTIRTQAQARQLEREDLSTMLGGTGWWHEEV